MSGSACIKGTILFLGLCGWLATVALPHPWYLAFFMLPAALLILFVWVWCCAVFEDNP